MKKKIYTFTLSLFVVLFLIYFVWALAANIQKEALKRHLSEEWFVKLSDENITTNGFPFKFGIKVSNFQSPLKNTQLTLEFLNLELVRLIYNISDVILFINRPKITSMVSPKFNSSSNKMKISISNTPFSGRFRLITEQEDWQITGNKKFKGFEAKKVIFALKDANEMKLDFYFEANDLVFSSFDKIQKRDSEKANKLTLKGTVFNRATKNREILYNAITPEFIILEQLNMNIGFLKLSCNDMIKINFFDLTTEDDFDCLLRLSSKDISKVKNENQSIQSIIDLINLIFIMQNPTNNSEPREIPVKFSLNKGFFFINSIPVYQFPTRY
tara:strand:- start:685 stop:1668 length:984 start_codon:yes stop_codon:yes gene_type:complete